MNEWIASRGLLAAAAGIVLGAAFVWWWEPEPPPPAAATAAAVSPGVTAAANFPALFTEPATPGAAVAAATTPVPVPSQRVARTRGPGDDPTPDLSDYINEGERPTMAEVIQRLQRAGIQGGLAAFPPPGTRPPLIGLAVPEDFVLPEGYVRHHQATDDGQRIEAILMFAPDRQFLDAAGRPIEIPKDRVVPPELAPPGLPQRRIAVPPPADAGRPGS